MTETGKGQGFYDIRDALMRLIQERRQSHTYDMPSEYNLAEYFGVSRSLIRSVYQQLVELGYLESHQGRGYFICQCLPTVHLVLRGDQSFTQKMIAQGYAYESRQLPITQDAHAYYFTRLRIIDKIPMAIHRTRLGKNIFPHFPQEIGEETSLFAYLAKKGFEGFDSIYSRLLTQIPDQEMSRLLHCPSLTSLLLLETNTIDVLTQQELGQNQIFYRSDMVTFVLK